MRHLFMGEREERGRRLRGREVIAVDWESRRAEVTARRAAELADPVQRFYLRPSATAEPGSARSLAAVRGRGARPGVMSERQGVRC